MFKYKRTDFKITQNSGLTCDPTLQKWPSGSGDETALTEEELLKKLNKTRLKPHHERLLNGEIPHPTPALWTHHTVRYKRRLYGCYGETSGINPGLMWPTHDELAERLEYEKVAYPFTLQEMTERKKELRRLEKENHAKRAKEIEGKMALVEKMKEDIIAKKLAKEKEIAAAKAKRDDLMEEVRRHFGYIVDPRDERFQELLAKKEKAQKKAQKEAKKAERQKMLVERLSEGLTKETQILPIKAASPSVDEDIEEESK
ncbi:unnamed protein product [Allacma fusca]|uniref:39S ribosomal protein L59, mitochondrial n=1 Tax=Allacma fusca TaxID=39272 RepID=A0A8J2J9N8_9HEXA|nr:unnamed protein product [Allacma fusca]